MCGHSSLVFYSHCRPEKMGCCFSKVLNPGLQNERRGLLQPPLHDGLNEVTEQVRQHAAAVAQHVCLEEEESRVVDGPAKWKLPQDEERPAEVDNKVLTEAAAVRGDKTRRSERDLKPGSTHEEEQAIIITTSTNIHTNTDTAAGSTHTARPSCEPAPYMEVSTQSPARQKILENATLRALWFNQLPEEEKKAAGSWSAPARLPSSNCQGNIRVSEVSNDQPPPPAPVSACQETQRDSPRAERKDGDSGEACVITTALGQGFKTRTQSFYSICSIDADDLDHDHDHSQSQTAGATHSLHPAEVETAALPCIVESPLPSQSHPEASTACDQKHVTESKMTSQSHDEEPATQSRAAEQSSTVPSQTASPHPVVSPQLVDPLPLSEDPQATPPDRPDTTGDLTCQTAAKDTDESTGDALLMSNTDENARVDKKNERVTGSEAEILTEDCVCSEEQSVFLEGRRAADQVFNATQETSVGFQEKESDQSVDSGVNPLDSRLYESDLITEKHVQSSQPAIETPEQNTSSQSLSSSKLDLKALHREEDILPLPGRQIELDESSLHSEAISVSICRAQSEAEDVGRSSTADTSLTEVSSVSTISAVSSLPVELTAFSCHTDLTPLSDFTITTSDKLDFNSNDPTFELSRSKPPSQDSKFDECDADVKTDCEVLSLQNEDEPFQDVLMSGDDRQVVNKPKPETCQNGRHVERGDVTAGLPETALNSLPETSGEKCDMLFEHCDDCTAVNTSVAPQDCESGIEDSCHSPPAAESERCVLTSSTPPLSSSCTSFEEGEQRFSSETEARTAESGRSQIQLKVNPPEKVCDEGEETAVAQENESAHTVEQHSHNQPASSVSSDCLEPDVDLILQHEASYICLSEASDSSDGVLLDEINQMKTSPEEHAAPDSDIAPETPTFTVTQTLPSVEVCVDTSICGSYMIPHDISCEDHRALISDCQEDHSMILVDPGQIDMYASTPSYEIHFLGHGPSAAAAEEGEREGGMREMVSELLGEDADSSVCRLYPHPWIRLGLEESCGGWAQGIAEPSQAESETGTDAEQIPALVSELQPSMALLGAYPYSTVMPQGSCVWDWHTDCTQSVSVHSTHETDGPSEVCLLCCRKTGKT